MLGKHKGGSITSNWGLKRREFREAPAFKQQHLVRNKFWGKAGDEITVAVSRRRGPVDVLTCVANQGSGRHSEKTRGKKLNRGSIVENGWVRAGSTLAKAWFAPVNSVMLLSTKPARGWAQRIRRVFLFSKLPQYRWAWQLKSMVLNYLLLFTEVYVIFMI